jgi:competence protein ComEA
VVDLLRPPPPEPPRERVRRLLREQRDRLRALTAPRVLVGAGGAVVAAVLAMWLLRTPPPPVDARLPLASASTVSPSSGSTVLPLAPAAGASAAPGSTIVVQAAGAVSAPGVYHMPAGSRVVDLVAVAGGATADAAPGALNLAAVLVDGARVQVPRVGESVPPTVVADAPAGPLDLNTATAAQLDQLPGVGPSLAAAIVRARERQGPFASVDGLLDVPGIGPAKLDALRDLVRV